jgi:tRNA(Ile)-lysidine synthase
MEDITPGIVRLLERQADVLRADDDYLAQVADGLYRSLVTVDADGIQRFESRALAVLPEALKRRLMRHLLQRTDPEHRAPSLRAVESVLRLALGRSKGTRLSVRGADVIKDRDRMLIMPRTGQATAHRRSIASVAKPMTVCIPSSVYWPGTGQEIHVQEMSRRAAEPYLMHGRRDCAVFDAARVSSPLVLRAWQAGDRMYPQGMGGKTKKLQDYFTDLKLSRQERTRIPLLAAPEGILWVVGRRQDERFMARKSTSRCLVATVHSPPRAEGAE